MADVQIDQDEVIRQLGEGLSRAAEEFVPWFFQQMPETYFRNVDEATRMEHMRAVLALRASGQEPRVRIRSNDGRRVTYVLPRDYPGLLVDLLMYDFGDDLIRSAKLYCSHDAELVIDIFEVGPSQPCNLDDPFVKRIFQQTLALARQRGEAWTEETLRAHFRLLSEDSVKNCPPARILGHARLYQEVSQSKGSSVVLDNTLYPNHSRIILAVANVPAKRMLIRVANRFKTLSINVDRAYVDAIQAGEEESVVIISAVVQGPDGGQIDPRSLLWQRLHRDLLRLKWLDRETLALGYENPEMGLGGADILHTYCDLAHQLLVKTNRYYYSRARIREIAEKHIDLSLMLVNLFRERFDPDRELDDADYELREHRVREHMGTAVEDEITREIFTTMLDAITSTLKTNYYVVGRFALALRLSSDLMMRVAPRNEKPYGIFFVHGRDFNAFHVRFRQTARGGVRVVRPSSDEQFIRESERHFDEVFELAYAQQLKNKDIPEGGAKAVILVRPGQTINRCVRAFADAILDLITDDEKTQARIVDRLGIKEWIYFGPDENITPGHINWIVERAAARGYRFPNALMSSKPGAGINHKEYGVTSEGVNVFLEVALKSTGIDPRRQPFTLKITGGPDGDVAGNLIKIVVRDYGANVRIVGIADGFGCAEDPVGLDHQELLRLVKASSPISEFDRGRLSPQGRLTLVSDPDGSRLRNEMHNRVIADAFVPAGGRPETINTSNWKRFLTAEGKPSSPIIVEGANLFITGEARRLLFDAGVLIVKDSSANKCGVICSSYEIMASLMISQAEFLEIKPRYVQEVLQRLREVAGLEARLLFEERKRRPTTPLVDLSILLSREIRRVNDALSADYLRVAEQHPDLVRACVLEHIPPSLQAKAGDRIWSVLPKSYRQEIVCAFLASHIIYREGFDYFRDTPDSHLVDLTLAYFLRDRRNRELVEEVKRSGMRHADEVAELLRIGGTRAGLHMAPGA